MACGHFSNSARRASDTCGFRDRQSTLNEYDLAARISQFIVLHDNVARWRRLQVNPRLVRAASNAIRYRPKIVHNGFDPGFAILNDQATKCYPHFDAVVAELKKTWPDIRFVQLGVATSKTLTDVDVNLVNRTTIAETASIIAGALPGCGKRPGALPLDPVWV